MIGHTNQQTRIHALQIYKLKCPALPVIKKTILYFKKIQFLVFVTPKAYKYSSRCICSEDYRSFTVFIVFFFEVKFVIEFS